MTPPCNILEIWAAPPKNAYHLDIEGPSIETMVKGEVESSVFFCNFTQTLMHPHSTKHSTNIMTPCQLTCRQPGSSTIMRSSKT